MGSRLGDLRRSLTGQPADPGPAVPSAEPAAVNDGPQRVVAVLGMHRSGTSSLVGSLEEAGLPLGEVRSVGGESNQKGHREPGELIKLHDDVLITSGGAWHLPPDKVVWTVKHRERRDEFIESRAELPLWGFKEPRTLLVIEAWLEVLPALEMVGTFRHPAVVARSLQRRHGGDTADMWLDVWLAYNGRLLELVEDRGFGIIDFDLPGEQYQARLQEIIAELHLSPPGPDGEFFDSSLRNSQKQAPPEVGLPAEVERVYTRLVRIAAKQARSAE